MIHVFILMFMVSSTVPPTKLYFDTKQKCDDAVKIFDDNAYTEGEGKDEVTTSAAFCIEALDDRAK